MRADHSRGCLLQCSPAGTSQESRFADLSASAGLLGMVGVGEGAAVSSSRALGAGESLRGNEVLKGRDPRDAQGAGDGGFEGVGHAGSRRCPFPPWGRGGWRWAKAWQWAGAPPPLWGKARWPGTLLCRWLGGREWKSRCPEPPTYRRGGTSANFPISLISQVPLPRSDWLD
jgi:hypothetical protein